MHFSTVFAAAAALSASVVSARPSPVIEKRATITDTPDGWASLGDGTTGGAGGTTTTVSSLAQFTAAVSGDSAAVVIVSGTISGAARVKVGSNKSIIGKKGAALTGVGLYVNKVKNVIIRNLSISKVLAENGDAIGIQASSYVWVDHVDVSSDRDHDKDYYDGLIDITHACDYITVSNSKIHDHWKAVLIGHSDNNGSEDKGHLTVTLHDNYWYNLNSRLPSFRFGTGHIYNNYYADSSDGVNSRQGAQLLVECNVFDNLKKPIYSTDAGYVVANNNQFVNAGTNEASVGTLSSVSYKYTCSAPSESSISSSAGATLSF